MVASENALRNLPSKFLSGRDSSLPGKFTLESLPGKPLFTDRNINIH